MSTAPAPGFAASPVSGWSIAWAPRVKLTVSEWADRYRRLPETSAARGARWRTATAPYLAGIMNAILEPGVKKVACIACAQVGKTESLLNMVGYSIAHAPSPMLIVPPTFGDAERFSKGRLSDMIRTTPELRRLVTDRRVPSKDERAESTILLKQFPGGFLALGGANTPNTFAAISVQLAIGDDVDRWPVLQDEGDPADLLMNRVRTFHDGRAVYVSTPTLKGGRIDTLYSMSDQRRYFVACPRCGHEDWITWSDKTRFRVTFDDRDAATATIECPTCEARHGEAARRAMIARGEWRPTAEPKEAGLVGFHVPGMLSPWVSLKDLVAEFLAARAKGIESFRVFVNTVLGEAWEERGARVEAHTLRSRVEDYGVNVYVPAGALCLTAGVDVQADRFEIQVIGWGLAEERWVIDTSIVPGDPKRAETQAALLEALGERYRHETGHMLPIHATCIDSGYATEEIYDFVLAHQVRRIFATKGFAGRTGEPIVGKPSEKKYGRRPRPVRLYPINVDDAKREILNSLTLVSPGPGYCHFPPTVDEEYFAQLCAEHKETRYNKAGIATHTVWVQNRERNEALDTQVLALAAFRILRPNLLHYAAILAQTPPGGGPQSSGGGGAAPATQRRVGRSGYLGR